MSLSRTNTILSKAAVAFTTGFLADLDVRPGRGGDCTRSVLVARTNSPCRENSVFVAIRLRVPDSHLRRFCYMGSISEADATRGGVRRQKRGCRHWFWLRGLLYGIVLLIYHTNDANILTQRAADVL